MLSDSTSSSSKSLNGSAKKTGWQASTFLLVVGLLLVTIGMYFLTQITAGILVGIGTAMTHRSSPAKIEELLTNSVPGQFFYILLAELLVIVMVRQLLRRQGKKLSDIGFGKPRLSHVSLALLGAVVFYGLVFVASAIIFTLIPEINTDQSQDIGFNNISTHSDVLISLVSLVILPPLGEEVLMRGYLFTNLRQRLRFWPAAILTSALFGIAHLELGSGQPPLWTAAVDTTVLSFVLVYLRERSGSLWPGIYVHAINNLIAYTIHFRSALF